MSDRGRFHLKQSNWPPRAAVCSVIGNKIVRRGESGKKLLTVARGAVPSVMFPTIARSFRVPPVQVRGVHTSSSLGLFYPNFA